MINALLISLTLAGSAGAVRMVSIPVGRAPISPVSAAAAAMASPAAAPGALAVSAARLSAAEKAVEAMERKLDAWDAESPADISFAIPGIDSVELIPEKVTTQRDATLFERIGGSGYHIFGEHQTGHTLFLNDMEIGFVKDEHLGAFTSAVRSIQRRIARGKTAQVQLRWGKYGYSPELEGIRLKRR